MNKKILFAILIAMTSLCLAQTNPQFSYGQVPTAVQWNGYFSAKQDYVAPGASGNILTSNGSTNWTSEPPAPAANIGNGTANAIPYQSAPNTTTFLPQGNGLLQENAGAPSWLAFGTSVNNPGTGTLESLIPVQTISGTSHTFATADLFQKTRRTNSGVAMTDTFPASTATGLVDGTQINIANADATASDTVTAGAGTSIGGNATFVIPPGRDVWWTYDAANTTWRAIGNTASSLVFSGTAATASQLYGGSSVAGNALSVSVGSGCTLNAGVLSCTGTGGTVTSVGMTVPSWLSVSGSPVTTSGTLAVTAAGGQTANQFIASPNGSTGSFSPRSIVAADLPTATTSALGVMQAGTGLSVSGGVVTPTFGTGANQVAQGGVITAGGPVGSATTTPVITYNAAGQLTNVGSATVTPSIGNVTGLGTGVSGALGTAVGSAGAFVANGGALGTPSSGTLTNVTGLPVSTGVSGLGAGVAAALGNTASGGGSVCLTTNCVMTTPNIGTPSAATLTNATGLPLSGLTSQSANTILGTATVASPSALSIPSCSTSGSALLWTSGTGFGCNTSIAANTAISAANAISATNLANTGAVSANAIFYPQFVAANTTSNQGGNTTSSLAFNPSTGTLSATTFSGAGTSLTGTASSLTAGAVPASGVIGILAGANGGDGVANTGTTLTRSGNVTYSGAYSLTQTLTAATNITLPTSGTVISSANALSGAVTGTPSSTTYLRGDGTWSTPSSGASVINGYINGFTLSNDGITPNSVLDIATGYAADSTNASMITGIAFTKSTAGAWGAGTGNNGMGTGLTVLASTWYHVFVIINSGSYDVYFDTSAAGTNAPSGTTYKRYVGSFMTDSSSHILAFTQYGQKFLYGISQTGVANGTASTETAITIPSPPGFVTFPLLIINEGGTPAAGDTIRVYAGTSSTNEIIFKNPSTAGLAANANVQATTNTSSQISYLISTTSSGNANISVIGYINPHVSSTF